jgi:hypothetical protein
MTPNRLSHGLGDFSKEWVRKAKKEQPDGEGARGHQAAGNPDRLVVEFLGRCRTLFRVAVLILPWLRERGG